MKVMKTTLTALFVMFSLASQAQEELNSAMIFET